MLSFENDYSRAAHPAVLEAVAEANNHLYSGYGSDELSDQAKAKIREACGQPDADVWFLVGGTQTNQVVIDTITPAYAGVVAVASGHPNVHEAGAIEATGHKVIALPTDDGKITARQIEDYVHWHRTDPSSDFIVQPGMVYISHPTECGTLYTKSELTAIYDACQRCGLRLFIDGARLGYGLMTDGTDVTLQDVAHLCDVFYIGGTKVGTLFGEAVVITEPALKKDFLFMMKQHGARLAKGRLLGIQFDALFTDDLYLRISRHAIDMAHQIREIFVSAGYPLLFDSPTNQQYPILPDSDLAELGKSFGYEYWERVDETHSGVRFCASWATTQENVDALRAAVQALKK